MSKAVEEKAQLGRELSSSSKELDTSNSLENTITDWKGTEVRGIEFFAEVLPSAYHQGSATFGVFAGSQCGSMVTVAAVMKKNKSISKWTTADLNNVLCLGNDYHSKQGSKDARNYVDINDCSGIYKVDDVAFSFSAKDFGVARVSFDNSQSYLKKLEAILTEIIKDQLDVSLVFNGYTFGLFCEDNFVYFFNSHCSSYLEDSALSGSASVLKLHLDVAAEGLAALIEETYSPEGSASCNDRTIQISVLSVTTEGNPMHCFENIIHIGLFKCILIHVFFSFLERFPKDIDQQEDEESEKIKEVHQAVNDD